MANCPAYPTAPRLECLSWRVKGGQRRSLVHRLHALAAELTRGAHRGAEAGDGEQKKAAADQCHGRQIPPD